MEMDEDFLRYAIGAVKSLAGMCGRSNSSVTDSLLTPAFEAIADAVEGEIDACIELEKKANSKEKTDGKKG